MVVVCLGFYLKSAFAWQGWDLWCFYVLEDWFWFFFFSFLRAWNYSIVWMLLIFLQAQWSERSLILTKVGTICRRGLPSWRKFLKEHQKLLSVLRNTWCYTRILFLAVRYCCWQCSFGLIYPPLMLSFGYRVLFFLKITITEPYIICVLRSLRMTFHNSFMTSTRMLSMNTSKSPYGNLPCLCFFLLYFFGFFIGFCLICFSDI